jgi:hypothetical protein
MYKRKDPIHVLLVGGEAAFSTSDMTHMLLEARTSFDQHITDHRRQDLPFKITEEDERWFDIEVHTLDGESQHELPFQEWLDDYYREEQAGRRQDEESEYRRFIELLGRLEEAVGKAPDLSLLRDRLEQAKTFTELRAIVMGGGIIDAMESADEDAKD